MKARACRLWVREYFHIVYIVVTFPWENLIEFAVLWFITKCFEILAPITA